jgi:SAM-dependent methyltransferase
MNNLKHILKSIVPPRFRTGLKYLMLRTRYSGKNYYCPVCRSHTRLQHTLGVDSEVIREKEIIGAGVRTALCPVCNASDRIRLLYLFLKKRTRLLSDPIRLLHFAPEPPLEYIFKKHKNIRYLSADLYQEGVMETIDITAIPYPENSFDAILCNHVLEHIPDDALAMGELYRVLSPGGWAVLQVPFSKVLDTTYEDPSIVSEEDRERVFGQKDHVRIYGWDYSKRLENAGFRVEAYTWADDPDPAFHDPRLNLNRDELVFFCSK